MDWITRLDELSGARQASTTELHEAVRQLLSILEPHVEIGENVTIDKHELSYVRVRSNVGCTNFWVLADADHHCYLERPLDSEGYLHNDFHCPLPGPKRRDLLAFAVRAQRFVEHVLARLAQDVTDLQAAHVEVATATKRADDA